MYGRLIAAFKANLSNVEIVAYVEQAHSCQDGSPSSFSFPDFQRLREAVVANARTLRESRTRGTTSASTKAADAAEKRLQQAFVKGLAPDQFKEHAPRIRPRPTEGALAADSRHAATCVFLTSEVTL